MRSANRYRATARSTSSTVSVRVRDASSPMSATGSPVPFRMASTSRYSANNVAVGLGGGDRLLGARLHVHRQFRGFLQRRRRCVGDGHGQRAAGPRGLGDLQQVVRTTALADGDQEYVGQVLLGSVEGGGGR